MKKEIPEINTLLEGINDPDTMLDPSAAIDDVTVNDVASSLVKAPSQDAGHQAEPPLEQSESLDEKQTTMDEGKEKYWNDFMSHLNTSDQRNDKDERLNCKLDRDLADSLDDCNIGNRCRSDLVNAIIRTFFDTFLSRLVQYRRERKSLFQNYTNA